MYDQAAEKLKQATGGDQGVMQYVQKYRDFAKKHPIAQSLIYGALITAAGVSGAGAGGAAALGLFKMVDKLLQGEKFSSAAYAGAKTGAMAYAAGQIGKALKGGQQPPTDNSPADYSDSYPGYTIANQPVIPGQPLSDLQLSMMKVAMDQGKTYPAEIMAQFAKQVGGANESRNLTRRQVQAIFERIARLNNRMLSEGRLEEGIWDDIKSGAGKGLQGIKNVAGKAVGAVAQGAAKVGHSMTTKVTGSTLQKAWEKAGKPTDSAEIEKLLQAQGVNPEVIKTVFQANKIPVTPAPATPGATDEPAVFTPGGNRDAQAQPSTQQGGTQQPQGGTQQPQAATKAFPDVTKYSPEQKQQLLTMIDQALAGQGKPHTGGRQKGGLSQTPNAVRQRQARAAKAQPTTQPTAKTQQGMTDLTQPTPSSSGGTITPTATGYVHTANPNNPNLAKPQAEVPINKIKGSKGAGAPTPEEYAAFQKKLQAARQAQGV